MLKSYSAISSASIAAFWVIFAFCISSCDDGSQRPKSGEKKDKLMEELASNLKRAVVSVEARGKDKKVKLGTGFFIDSKGSVAIVATCAHLVAEADQIRIKTLTGAEYTFKGVRTIDKNQDLALLAVEAQGIAPLTIADNLSVPVGTRIVVYGNPMGLKGSFSEGVVSAIRKSENGKDRLQISAPISPGSSGSPILNLKGELVGMATSGIKEGEGLGFAVSAEIIKSSLHGHAQTKQGNKEKDVYRESVAKSRTRYLPGKKLSDDPEWKNGELPSNAAQRIVVLKRLIGRYPDSAILQIKLADALRDDGRYDDAFGVITRVINKDPGNRLALTELDGVIVKEQRKIPYFEAAIKADPLNYRARLYLVSRQMSDGKFSSAMLDARRAIEMAPFTIRLAEEHIDACLSLALFDEIRNGREGSYLLAKKAILQANELREIIILAGDLAVNPSKQALAAFLAIAEKHPEKSFPYAYQLFRYGGHKDLQELLGSEVGKKLKKLIQDAMLKYPLEAEAFLLDYTSVGFEHDLLTEELYWGQSNFRLTDFPGGVFNILGFILLHSSADQEQSPMSPDEIVRLKKLYDERRNMQEKASEIRRGLTEYAWISKSSKQVIWDLWLAIQKEQLQELLSSDKTAEAKKESIRSAIAALKGVTSKQEAIDAVRSAVKSSKFGFWNYWGDEYSVLLRSIFERAAR